MFYSKHRNDFGTIENECGCARRIPDAPTVLVRLECDSYSIVGLHNTIKRNMRTNVLTILTCLEQIVFLSSL